MSTLTPAFLAPALRPTRADRDRFVANLTRGTVLECTRDEFFPNMEGTRWAVRRDGSLVDNLGRMIDLSLPVHTGQYVTITPNSIEFRVNGSFRVAWNIISR